MRSVERKRPRAAGNISLARFVCAPAHLPYQIARAVGQNYNGNATGGHCNDSSCVSFPAYRSDCVLPHAIQREQPSGGAWKWSRRRAPEKDDRRPEPVDPAVLSRMRPTAVLGVARSRPTQWWSSEGWPPAAARTESPVEVAGGGVEPAAGATTRGRTPVHPRGGGRRRGDAGAVCRHGARQLLLHGAHRSLGGGRARPEMAGGGAPTPEGGGFVPVNG
jgi:hypothetical protein